MKRKQNNKCSIKILILFHDVMVYVCFFSFDRILFSIRPVDRTPRRGHYIDLFSTHTVHAYYMQLLTYLKLLTTLCTCVCVCVCVCVSVLCCMSHLLPPITFLFRSPVQFAKSWMSKVLYILNAVRVYVKVAFGFIGLLVFIFTLLCRIGWIVNPSRISYSKNEIETVKQKRSRLS